MPALGKKHKRRPPISPPSNSKYTKLVIPRPNVLNAYLRHEEINMYLEYLQNRYSFVEVHTLGNTHENRVVKAIEINWFSQKNVDAIAREEARRLSHPTEKRPSHLAQKLANQLLKGRKGQQFDNPNTRNIVFIEAGTHAREWITIAVALNCIHQLTEKYLRHLELLRKLRFIIVPVVNPDGYEYSWTKNRLWRKNRRPIGKQQRFVGTDLNRNYDIHWEDGPSKINNNTYRGNKPFSEPETRALRNALLKHRPNLLFFLSLHSYSQCIMYPWGFSKELPPKWLTMEKVAKCGRNAIRAYDGRVYRVGSIFKVTKRRITGSIVDYAFGVMKVPLALVMELPSSEYGFQPPAESISPIGHESWFGIREMCKAAYNMIPSLSCSETHLKTELSNATLRNAKKAPSRISSPISIAADCPSCSRVSSKVTQTPATSTVRLRATRCFDTSLYEPHGSFLRLREAPIPVTAGRPPSVVPLPVVPPVATRRSAAATRNLQTLARKSQAVTKNGIKKSPTVTVSSASRSAAGSNSGISNIHKISGTILQNSGNCDMNSRKQIKKSYSAIIARLTRPTISTLNRERWRRLIST